VTDYPDYRDKWRLESMKDFFTKQGYPQPGIHLMSLPCFYEMFGTNPHRINLLFGFNLLLALLIRAGCQEIYIGGSFITNIEDPNDIDGCFDGMCVDISTLDPIFSDRLDEQKSRFGCELRVDYMSAFQGFLRTDRDGQSVGIIVISLTDLDIKNFIQLD
jgi:hypothetical protein